MTAYRFFSIKKCSSWKCYLIFKNRYPGGKGWLNFVEEKAKVDCITLATCFQISSKTAIACCPPDSSSSKTAPAHTAHRTGCRPNCPDIITKDQWPPNLPDINPMDYHVWGAMLEAYHKPKTKPKTIASGYLGQPVTGTDRQRCERLLKGTEGLCWSWQWTLRTFTVTIQNAGIWSLVNCVV